MTLALLLTIAKWAAAGSLALFALCVIASSYLHWSDAMDRDHREGQ